MRGLRLEGVRKSWEGFSLDVDLHVGEGEYFIILGPTGSGKTLLLRTILGFHRADEGAITLNGRDITNEPPEDRGLGYVPQNQALFPHMTVRQNIGFGLKVRGGGEGEIHRAVNEILGLLGLEELADRRPSTLSGGERQKVALGRALALRPPVILLDEPLSNIDAESRRRLRGELKRLHRELELTFIHVTHDQAEAYNLASKIAVMRGGRLAQIGGAREIFSNPRDEETARFLGYENILLAGTAGREDGLTRLVVDGTAFLSDTEVEEGEAVIALRNDALSLSREQPREAHNVLKGVITDYSDLGPVVTVSVDVGVVLNVDVSKNQFMELGLADDDVVWLHFSPGSVKVLE